MEEKRLILIVILAVIFGNILKSQSVPTKSYEGSYLFQGIFPSGLHNKDWFPDDYEVQGVTNDGKNWFFTSIDRDTDLPVIWRIPKNVPLDGNVSGNSGVISKSYSDNDLKDLVKLDAYHWGDLDHFNYSGVDYIFIPIQRRGKKSIIACFRADNLQFINYSLLDRSVYPGWCAIGVDSALYTSANDIGSIARYEVEWEKLLFQYDHDCFSFPETIPITNTDGSDVNMTDLQGGEFSPSGEMLYLVSGRCLCARNGAAWSEKDGIHAIETNTWTRLDQSIKNSEPANHFSYDYNADCTWCGYAIFFPPFYITSPVGCHTPEGVTFWDLEDESVENVTGSLHVLIDFFTAIEIGPFACDEDKLYLYHYSTNVHIDKNSNGGSGLAGTPSNPFLTVSDAVIYYPIWDGSQLIIKSGNYNDQSGEEFPIVIDKRLKMNSEGGSAIIGQN